MSVARKSNKVGLGDPPSSELSLVRLTGELVLDDGRTLPAGATGAVMFVHAAGEACEGEFVTPLHAVVTVMAPSLTRAA